MAGAITLGAQNAQTYPAGRLLLHAPPDFEAPIKPMSALVAATILWLSFTLLELVDVVEDSDPASGLGFIQTEEYQIQHEHTVTRVGANPGAELLTGKTEDLCLFFCRTEVEFGIGLALLIEWTGEFSRCPHGHAYTGLETA